MEAIFTIGWTDWNEASQQWEKFSIPVYTFPELDSKMAELQAQGQLPRSKATEYWRKLNNAGRFAS